MEADQTGIVYVLTNPAMPGLVKIGRTSKEDVEIRLKELYSTGVPVPFECAYAAKVKNQVGIEKAFHGAFAPYRINSKREFFEIEPDQAIGILKCIEIEDVTPALQEEAERVDPMAAAGSKKLKARRPVMNYVHMGIPIGSEITFGDTGLSARVVTERKIEFEGQEFFMTKLTTELKEAYPDKIHPGCKWIYNGKSVDALYDEVYGPAYTP